MSVVPLYRAAAAADIEIKTDTGKPPYNVAYAAFALVQPVGASRHALGSGDTTPCRILGIHPRVG